MIATTEENKEERGRRTFLSIPCMADVERGKRTFFSAAQGVLKDFGGKKAVPESPVRYKLKFLNKNITGRIPVFR